MSNQSERIRTALLRKSESGQPSVPAEEEAQGDTAMSSISVSEQNLEAMLQSANGKPGVEAPRSPGHAASVSADVLQALLPPEELAELDSILQHDLPVTEATVAPAAPVLDE